MSNLRDEEILIQHSRKTHRPRLQYMTVDLSAQDCQFYGHSWQAGSTAGTKCCTQCGIVGYCPGCTSVSPIKAAHPFYCTRHTSRHEQREEEEV